MNENYDKLTFIYSGHGGISGLVLNKEILEYKTLVYLLIGLLKENAKCQIKSLRIILDCCYAASIREHIINFLYKETKNLSPYL